MEHKVKVFFYGSYINYDVLAEVDLKPECHQVARLPGYGLLISPLANIEKRQDSHVYGILVEATHAELQRLYDDHAEKVLGGRYLPEAVLVATSDSAWVPCLTYISHDMEKSEPDPAYVQRIYKPAEDFGFPSHYLETIQSFA